ncbi:hypothetical protein GGX14DRAFT_625554 [Mycena pura]|uniref:Uncharacterized protein n=1 Tax=Mycena pura TaxID=153505 RepID=A0AAD6VFD8_9AGAR|nr:hypothetical protein GGX14DRAFT_625554 [Mycena pura]
MKPCALPRACVGSSAAAQGCWRPTAQGRRGGSGSRRRARNFAGVRGAARVGERWRGGVEGAAVAGVECERACAGAGAGCWRWRCRGVGGGGRVAGRWTRRYRGVAGGRRRARTGAAWRCVKNEPAHALTSVRRGSGERVPAPKRAVQGRGRRRARRRTLDAAVQRVAVGRRRARMGAAWRACTGPAAAWGVKSEPAQGGSGRRRRVASKASPRTLLRACAGAAAAVYGVKTQFWAVVVRGVKNGPAHARRSVRRACQTAAVRCIKNEPAHAPTSVRSAVPGGCGMWRRKRVRRAIPGGGGGTGSQERACARSTERAQGGSAWRRRGASKTGLWEGVGSGTVGTAYRGGGGGVQKVGAACRGCRRRG